MPGADAIPLSLYIHIPWCVRKCPYCDFNSHAVRDELDESGYVAALLADLDGDLLLANGRPLQSIFIGGGTPSLFSAAAIGDLLDGVRARLPLVADVEITLEANPGTVDAAQFSGYRAAGINRLSMGVQSLDDAKLAALGRIHSAVQARDAYATARQAGFDNINLDMMFGLPGQTVEEGLDDLQQAVNLGPEHLSWYQLTIEPNTAFSHDPPATADDDVLWELQEQGWSLLVGAGYRQYEVSAYAREGRRCRHNLNYWTFGDYLGIGAGAHGKLTRSDGSIWRRWKLRHPEAYLSAAAGGLLLAGERQVGGAELPVEFMLNALRLVDGVPAALFPERTGLTLASISRLLELARERGLLSDEPQMLLPSELGRRFLDDLVAIFEPEERDSE